MSIKALGFPGYPGFFGHLAACNAWTPVAKKKNQDEIALSFLFLFSDFFFFLVHFIRDKIHIQRSEVWLSDGSYLLHGPFGGSYKVFYSHLCHRWEPAAESEDKLQPWNTSVPLLQWCELNILAWFLNTKRDADWGGLISWVYA